MNTTIVELYRAARFWQARQLLAYTKESPYLYQPIIVNSILPHSSMTSAWILFAHLTVESFMPDGILSEGTFAYEVWTLQELDIRPRLVLEEVVAKTRLSASDYGMRSLATDIDRLAADRNTLYVRDRRLLQQSELDLVRMWRRFERPVPTLDNGEHGESDTHATEQPSACIE